MTLLEEINRLSRSKLGRLPDLKNPNGYNDKLNWLKLYDQRPEHVVACDKWAVRGMVERLAGPDVLIPASLVYPPQKYPCFAKATHDSGSACRLHGPEDLPRAEQKLFMRLANKYGAGKGEWAYDLVQPQIIVEQHLADTPIDYKFHCVNGEVRWVQVIWDRGPGTSKEAILMPDGSVSNLHMDEKMQHVPVASAKPLGNGWNALTELAQKLSADWRYVRVDLYWEWGHPWFGELTFWPRAGCYRCKDEPKFGAMMDIDTTVKFKPIVT